MAGTATLMALKATSDAKANEDRVAADRHRAVLVLVMDHLTAHGYTEAASALHREGGAPLARFATADNVDLGTIVREFETYYELKLGKKPKLVRKTDGGEAAPSPQERGAQARARVRGGTTAERPPRRTALRRL